MLDVFPLHSKRTHAIMFAVFSRGLCRSSERLASAIQLRAACDPFSGKLAGIDSVVLVPCFQQSILPWIADEHPAQMWLQQIVQRMAAGAFLKGDTQASEAVLS